MRSDIKHVTEIGVRNVIASYAFAKAAMGRNDVLVYRAHDLEMRPANRAMDRLMDQCPAIDYKFNAGDDLIVPVEETNFSFLDTWHTHRQLAAELKLLSGKARKLFGFHDTISFATVDEGLEGHGANRPEDKTLCAGQDRAKVGLKVAIDEFLDSHDEWQVLEDRRFNNGVMILERS